MGEFEKKLDRLKEIVSLLEKDDLSLEEGVCLFEEGINIVKFCREQLAHAKHKVEIYMEGLLKEFEEEENGSEEGEDFQG